MINLKFSEAIRAMHAELSPEYYGGAFQWIDEKFDGGFTKLADRMDKALLAYSQVEDYRAMNDAISFYRAKMVEWLRAYKAERQVDDEAQFLKSIGG